MVEVFPSSYANHGVSTIPEDSPINDVSRVAAATVAARILMGASVASRPENKTMTREEHTAMMNELNKKRAGWRTPRRGWSSTDSPVTESSVPTPPETTSSHAGEMSHRALPDRSLAAQHAAARKPAEHTTSVKQAQRPRPPLPPPRRSYSVMDYEPPSQTHRLSSRMLITDLPPELHYAVFDFLDPIDSTCLGLVNKQFYDIHRRMHGTVPLSTRREGPNDLEWAWRGAGPLVHPSSAPRMPKIAERAESSSSPPTPAAAPVQRQPHPEPSSAAERQAQIQALERLRVKGQVYCRKCGISRCELHRHLREWMASAGHGYEYCSVSAKYGPPAADDAKEFCHLRSPKKPHRCGRHTSRGGRTPPEQKS
ncbi:hypothetical protein HYQ45_008991 [Verticillium longisporum]|uniref:F-box domain-containing protein n=1 Tax=Verticillium longisporum TaxID=100787 RepID=A0A8I2ZJ31_VERLO|nr:hypothetical protein HYQ44_012650 [Verticillium longisporum]KAG7132697.1 hypothetical protein HYQ45_008991 [Verticillium longisporum]